MESKNRIILFLEKKYGPVSTKKILNTFQLQKQKYLEQGKK